MILYCSISFLAGMLLLFILSKTLNIFNPQEAQAKAELLKVKESFEKYQEQVNDHFTKTTQMTEEIQNKLQYLQSHLFSQSQLLTQTAASAPGEMRADFAVAKAILDQAQAESIEQHPAYLKKDV